MQVKSRIYAVYVRRETWPAKVGDVKRLKRMEMWMIRWMSHISQTALFGIICIPSSSLIVQPVPHPCFRWPWWDRRRPYPDRAGEHWRRAGRTGNTHCQDRWWCGSQRVRHWGHSLSRLLWEGGAYCLCPSSDYPYFCLSAHVCLSISLAEQLHSLLGIVCFKGVFYCLPVWGCWLL